MNAPAPNAAFFHETVLSVHHWTDQLFSFRTTRDQGLRFQAVEHDVDEAVSHRRAGG